MPAKQALVDAATATNAAAALTIPTYDGSGQLVHPDVVDTGVAGWNGYRYWMAMTPYPGTDNDYENPSIVASNDKGTWVVPDGLTNPVEPFPGGTAFNADCDLVLVGSTMYLFFITSEDDSGSVIHYYYRTTTDGITWADKIEITFNGRTGSDLSPSFVKTNTGWEVYYCNGHIYRETATTLAGPWSAPVDTNVIAWHVDVIRHDGMYYMLNMRSDYTLHFGASWDDGTTWYLKTADILSAGAPGVWDDFGFYRSTIQRTATGFDLWYTGKASAGDWRVGYTPITFSLE